jgi:hypothetical protein
VDQRRTRQYLVQAGGGRIEKTVRNVINYGEHETSASLAWSADEYINHASIAISRLPFLDCHFSIAT